MNVDVAIIGGGVAGLSAALSIDRKLRVAVFIKRKLFSCASAFAQGGIAAALAATDDADLHVADTLQVGGGLCNAAAVREIVGDGAAAIDWLVRQGVKFNRESGGGFALAREGGHQARRIAHVDDMTGRAVVEVLAKRLAERGNIQILEDFIAINLHVRDGVCNGFYALCLASQTIEPINAQATVLATGGASKVYLYATTPPDATGDGVAMAYRAGCRIANMEFVQFHPTCLYHPHAASFLVTEAMRGEGARLRNAAGDFFMESAGTAELAPRDIVARTIDGEMKRSGADCVYLDLSAHPPDFWRQRFPTVVRRCNALGLEVPAARIPVVPAAHYTCGGVATDVSGRTDVPGLFAIGETACNGLHGANRLASNSLLECVVSARLSAVALDEQLPPPLPPLPQWDERRISQSTEKVMLAHNWEELRRLMWNYVGIVRSDQRLAQARRRIEWIGEEIEEYYRRHAVSRDFLELRNLVQCAELIIEGALARRESRGLHFNVDCPQPLPVAADTMLSGTDFAKRRRAINQRCPFSGRLIVASGLADYAGHVVGFCAPQCRDLFAVAAVNNFAQAEQKVLAARAQFNALIA